MDHELALMVASGSDRAFGGGRLVENGSSVACFSDPFVNDLMLRRGDRSDRHDLR